MKILKRILCICIFSFAISSVSASDWYVCLGSFKVAANAQRFSATLQARGLPNVITTHNGRTGTLHRVVYDLPFKNRKEAGIFQYGLSTDRRIRALGISGLWICEAQIVEKTANAAPQQDEVLRKNETASLPVSEEKPYSLKVRSYKEEHPAQQNSERLRENDIDAYVVKTYDDESYFSFDVHAGAFETPEESSETKQALAELGIDDTELSDYTDIKEKMERYDEVVQQDNVLFENAENAAMPEFSEAVRKCLADLPVNKHFLIESIAIVDFETLAMADSKDLDRFKSLVTEGNIRALSKAVYFDDLFGKRVEVSVTECAKPFPELDFSRGEAAQFALPGEDMLHAFISSDETVHTVEGINTDRTLLVKIVAHDFSDDEFTSFMNNAWADSATVIYPQLRKSLCVLPKNADNRHFAAFTLFRVGESYAAEKNNANWAIPIVGHWNASGYFLQDNEEIQVGFYDMDYAHNAERVHGMFMTEHEKNILSDRNHPATVNGTDAWYTETSWKEISFSTKSFIVAVDSWAESSIDENILHDFASDLLIWEQ